MTPAKNTPSTSGKDDKANTGVENAPKTAAEQKQESAETSQNVSADTNVDQSVETTEKPELKSVKEVAGEVLAGRWGANYAIAAQKLEEAGYDTDAVWAEYTRRKAAGAPYAF